MYFGGPTSVASDCITHCDLCLRRYAPGGLARDVPLSAQDCFQQCIWPRLLAALRVQPDCVPQDLVRALMDPLAHEGLTDSGGQVFSLPVPTRAHNPLVRQKQAAILLACCKVVDEAARADLAAAPLLAVAHRSDGFDAGLIKSFLHQVVLQNHFTIDHLVEHCELSSRWVASDAGTYQHVLINLLVHRWDIAAALMTQFSSIYRDHGEHFEAPV